MEIVSAADSETAGNASALPVETEAMKAWRRCRPYIERAIASGPGLETIEDIERDVENRRLIFWAGKDGAAITRIDQFTNARILNVTYAAGDMADSELIARFMPDLENFARIAECSAITVNALPQHLGPLSEAGFSPLYVVFSKPIIPAEALAELIQPEQPAPAAEAEPAEPETENETPAPTARRYSRGDYGRGAYGKERTA